MKRKLVILLILGLLAWIIVSYIGAVYVSLPNPVKIPPSSKVFDFPVENVSLTTSDNVRIEGWYIPGDSSKAVLMANGIRGNRRGLIERAKLYQELGIGVLLIDLRGTGESQKEPIAFGWDERKDIIAAKDFLIEKGYSAIGAHGISLGASAITYSLQEEMRYDFVVLESCYDDIRNALNSRLKIYHVPKFCVWLMNKIGEKRLGIKMDQLRPVDYVSKLDVPVLFLAGDSEIRVKKTETETIFKKCASNDKILYFFEEAKHIDFLAFNAKKYQEVWSKFIGDL